MMARIDSRKEATIEELEEFKRLNKKFGLNSCLWETDKEGKVADGVGFLQVPLSAMVPAATYNITITIMDPKDGSWTIVAYRDEDQDPEHPEWRGERLIPGSNYKFKFKVQHSTWKIDVKAWDETGKRSCTLRVHLCVNL
jgi:hypothetical protein